jgi:hypothetical protein
MSGVAATSARRAWAVGSTSTNGHTAFRSPILRWDGTAWK